MNIRQLLDLRARHTEEQCLASAEKLKGAISFAKLLGYKRIAWGLLEKLGYDIKALGYRGK